VENAGMEMDLLDVWGNWARMLLNQRSAQERRNRSGRPGDCRTNVWASFIINF